MIHRRALCCVPRSGYGIATLCIFNTRVVEYFKDLPMLLARDAESIATTELLSTITVSKRVGASASYHVGGRSSFLFSVAGFKPEDFPRSFPEFLCHRYRERATRHTPRPRASNCSAAAGLGALHTSMLPPRYEPWAFLPPEACSLSPPSTHNHQRWTTRRHPTPPSLADHRRCPRFACPSPGPRRLLWLCTRPAFKLPL